MTHTFVEIMRFEEVCSEELDLDIQKNDALAYIHGSYLQETIEEDALERQILELVFQTGRIRCCVSAKEL